MKPAVSPRKQAPATSHQPRATPFRIAPSLRAIMEQEYPRFTRAEYERRHQALAAVMEQAAVDHLLIVTENRSGNATQWVTGWPGSSEALTIFKPGEQLWMSVEW